MRNLFLLVTLSFSSLVFAQNKEVAKKSFLKKVKISAGYSHMIISKYLGSGKMYTEDTSYTSPNTTTSYGNPDLTSNPDAVFPYSPLKAGLKSEKVNMNGFTISGSYRYNKNIRFKLEVSSYFQTDSVLLPGIITSAPWKDRVLLPLATSYTGFTVRSIIAFSELHNAIKRKHFNFLGGIEIENEEVQKKINLFGHALIGFSNQSFKFKNFPQREKAIYGKDQFSNLSFTLSIAGGVDIGLIKNLGLRLTPIDYNLVRINEQTLLGFKEPIYNTGIANNLTFSNIETAALYSNYDIRVKGWQHNFRFGAGLVMQL